MGEVVELFFERAYVLTRNGWGEPCYTEPMSLLSAWNYAKSWGGQVVRLKSGQQPPLPEYLSHG